MEAKCELWPHSDRCRAPSQDSHGSRREAALSQRRRSSDARLLEAGSGREPRGRAAEHTHRDPGCIKGGGAYGLMDDEDTHDRCSARMQEQTYPIWRAGTMKKVSTFLTLTCLAVASVATGGTLTLVSGPDSAQVYGPLDQYAALNSPLWGNSVPAVATWRYMWPEDQPEKSWPLIEGSDAVWISNTYLIQGNIRWDTWRLFTVAVTIPAGAWNISWRGEDRCRRCGGSVRQWKLDWL